MRRLLIPLLSLLLVPLALVFGIWAGGHPDTLPTWMRDALVSDDAAQVFDDALDSIAADYYKPVDREQLLDESLEAAVRSLDDPFSHYFDPEAYAQFRESTSGEFQGVGMTVQEIPAGLEVVAVFEDSPAERAGIEPGDRIVAVDGRSLAGKSSQASTALIKGPAGTKVRLTIISDGKRRQETLERARVEVPIVESRLVRRGGERFGYVSLAQFSSGAHADVAAALRRLKRRDADGIVLDLRGNGGGLLQEGVLVSSLFIPEGPIVSTRGRNRESQTYKATGDAIATDVPVVVLTDRGTASASEIVTGALQDRTDATVVGTRTFGKGVFQEIQPLPNGGALDITVGEYYTPGGRNLGPRDGKPGGIAPDVRAKDDPDTERDEALNRAIEVLAERGR